MKSRHSLLPIAVALAACLWVSDVMAQAATIPAGAIEKSRPSAHAGIDTHRTGEDPGAGEGPGAAQPAVGPASHSAALLRQRAFAAMEILREEIATLTALKHAQSTLLAWNRDRTEGGEAPVFLAAALCAEPALGAWCPLLPATFGTGELPGTGERPGTEEHPGAGEHSGTPLPNAENGHDRD